MLSAVRVSIARERGASLYQANVLLEVDLHTGMCGVVWCGAHTRKGSAEGLDGGDTHKGCAV